MRPEIARLVHPHIYEILKNHKSVLEYNNVKGVDHNLFFIQHSFPEVKDPDLISHSNPHEAQYLAALCKYLLQQGYEPTQITILVTYTGQLINMRKEILKQEFHNVRLATVDNFQGEENDIILLSLVRSNPEESVGFLRQDNRVCVALSRARIGFYCIGNFKMLCRKSLLWKRIISDMESKGHLGDALPLYCNNHPDIKFSAKVACNFSDNAPAGGCTEDCDYRLDCGHVCASKCHIRDPTHSEYKCQKPCVKKCPSGHPCPKPCFEECGDCTVNVERIIPECNHKVRLPCHKKPIHADCDKVCEKMLSCGHHCQGPCRLPCEASMCDINVNIPLDCGHMKEVKCHMKCHMKDFVFALQCTMTCEEKLPCGHSCKRKCCEPCTKKCEVLVNKTWPCGHKLKRKCYQILDPQTYPCKETCTKLLSCGHKCSKRCSEECTKVCKFPVKQQCPRGHVNRMPCSASMEDMRCYQRCNAALACGHACVGRCYDCHISRIHASCKFQVQLQHFCGHLVTVNCIGLKDSSSHHCRMHCPHKKCSHDCSRSCEPCMEPCLWQCPHHHCDKCCHKICDRPPCNERCSRKLKCGIHQCFGLCGEPCLEVCPICNRKQFREKLKHAKQFNEKELYVQLDCGHVFTAELLDSTILTKPSSATPVIPKQCPECAYAITASYRYGTAVKTYIENVSTINTEIRTQHLKVLTDEERSALLGRICKKIKRLQCNSDIYSSKLSHSRIFTDIQDMLLSADVTGYTWQFIPGQFPVYRRWSQGWSPDKAFIIKLLVTLIELFTSVILVPAAIQSKVTIFEQLDCYFERLKQEFNLCQLSHQLIEDLISEQYRLALVVHYYTIYSTMPQSDITTTKELLDRLAKDSSLRLTKDEYLKHSDLLYRHTASPGLCDYQLVHDTPMCQKGDWFCSNGQVHSVPATCECANSSLKFSVTKSSLPTKLKKTCAKLDHQQTASPTFTKSESKTPLALVEPCMASPSGLNGNSRKRPAERSGESPDSKRQRLHVQQSPSSMSHVDPQTGRERVCAVNSSTGDKGISKDVHLEPGVLLSAPLHPPPSSPHYEPIQD